MSLVWKVSHAELGKQDEGRIGSDYSCTEEINFLSHTSHPVGGDPSVTS